MPEQIRFNKTTIENIQTPSSRIEFCDVLIPELRLRVSQYGNKSFSVYKRLPGSKPIRVTIGKYPLVTPEQAKIKARKILGSLVDGVNPNEQKKTEEKKSLLVSEVYKDYLAHRRLKAKTIQGYDQVIKNQLSCIANLPLSEVTREKVSKIHKGEKSKGQADLAMRLLRSLFNFAKNEYLDADSRSLYPDNPVTILSHRKQWHNLPRKNTHLRQNEIPEFYKALKQVKGEETYTGISICNALKFALLTGLRRSEIFNLKWQDVNREAAYFTITDTKNTLPLELPLTPVIEKIFDEQESRAISDYVFGADNDFGQVREPKKVVAKIKSLVGGACNFHDLRRTFATTAEHLDVGHYKLKRLMNHVSGRNDVTAGYTILTSETLRSSAIKIQKKLNDY